MGSNEQYMLQTLDLAKQGQGKVHPNPLVGAILVKNDTIIGRGAHLSYGKAHAEINAIGDATESPEGATLFVNLEPCTYDGKTPPCVPAIVRAGISKVVVGVNDPNPKVNGRGIQQLREAGIDVITGVMEAESRELNRGFFRRIGSGFPWITLKLAMTIDGFIADANARSQWITGEDSRKQVHRWRADHNAILVGAGTVLQDDPSLSVRDVHGTDPVRIIIDPRNSTPPVARVFRDDGVPVVLFVSDKLSGSGNISRDNFTRISLPVDGNNHFNWETLLKTIVETTDIVSLLVEGGSGVASTLLESHFVDELIVMTGPKITGQGLSPFHGFSYSIDTAQQWTLFELSRYGNDICARYRPGKD